MGIGGYLLLVGWLFRYYFARGFTFFVVWGLLGLVIANCWLRCLFGVGGLGARACCCGLWIAAY